MKERSLDIDFCIIETAEELYWSQETGTTIPCKLREIRKNIYVQRKRPSFLNKIWHILHIDQKLSEGYTLSQTLQQRSPYVELKAG